MKALEKAKQSAGVPLTRELQHDECLYKLCLTDIAIDDTFASSHGDPCGMTTVSVIFWQNDIARELGWPEIVKCLKELTFDIEQKVKAKCLTTMTTSSKSP